MENDIKRLWRIVYLNSLAIIAIGVGLILNSRSLNTHLEILKILSERIDLVRQHFLR